LVAVFAVDVLTPTFAFVVVFGGSQPAVAKTTANEKTNTNAFAARIFSK
jgi:hypothetical protein